jgi:hypothetical protein
VKVFDHTGHEGISEDGCDSARATLYDWVSNRLRSVSPLK